MSTPLKPSLATVHPRAPKPRAQRPVQCPRCNHRFSISRKALSFRCPQCTEPLEFEDYHVRCDVKHDVTTLGQVDIDAGCKMDGKVVCGCLVNRGKFKGHARVYGAIQLAVDSLTSGQIVAQSLTAPPGSHLQAKLLIGPKFRAIEPTPPEPTPPNHFAMSRSRPR